MPISYKPLFKSLVERDMKKGDLLEIMSPTTVAKLQKGEYLGLQKIEEICCFLGCKIEDVVEVIPNEK